MLRTDNARTSGHNDPRSVIAPMAAYPCSWVVAGMPLQLLCSLTACQVFCRVIAQAVLILDFVEGAIDQSAVIPGRHPLNFRFSPVKPYVVVLVARTSCVLFRLNPALPRGTSTSSPVFVFGSGIVSFAVPVNRASGLLGWRTIFLIQDKIGSCAIRPLGHPLQSIGRPIFSCCGTGYRVGR